MRFGTTEDSELLVQWQWADGMPFLPIRTCFGSINWSRGGDAADTGPGEVVGAPRTWVNGAPIVSYPSPPTGYCGTESQWADGFGSDPLPALPIDGDGLPGCCTETPPVVTGCCPAGVAAHLYLGIRYPSLSMTVWFDLIEDGTGHWRGEGSLNPFGPAPITTFDLHCVEVIPSVFQWHLEIGGCYDDVVAMSSQCIPPDMHAFSATTVPAACNGQGFDLTVDVTVSNIPP